jgi:hypothetical protein
MERSAKRTQLCERFRNDAPIDRAEEVRAFADAT